MAEAGENKLTSNEVVELISKATKLITDLLPILSKLGKDSTWAEQLEKWEAIKNQTEPE